MHSKLLLIDDAVGITGGRNYQDDYYDWRPEPTTSAIATCWSPARRRARWRELRGVLDSRRSVPAERLDDVGRLLLREGAPPSCACAVRAPARATAMSRDASDAALVRERLVERAMPVGAVHFLADLPQKHRRSAPSNMRGRGQGLREIDRIGATRSAAADAVPGAVRPGAGHVPRAAGAPDRRRGVVSTNSLAATDAFIAYALSYKYKRRYLREFGFHIYEFKPFPAERADRPRGDRRGRGRSQGRRARDRRRLPVRLDAPTSTGAAMAAPTTRVARRRSSSANTSRRATSAAAAKAPTRPCRCSARACASACTPSRWWWTSASA
jgi:putative cardiolipin synthase